MKTFTVTHSSEVAQARRAVSAQASELGFSEEDGGRAALVATEMCTNMVKHAGRGELLLRPLEGPDSCGLELLGLDQGPGIADLAKGLKDGYSTAGSPGTGLGAISRLSQRFDIYSKPDKGTAVAVEIWPTRCGPGRLELDIGAVVVPKPGEQVCGDSWCYSLRPHGFVVLGVDGLGHGHHAALAAAEACRSFEATSDRSLPDVLQRMHDVLRPTRGAAVALVEIDWNSGSANAAGIGNLVAALAQGASVKRLAMDNGIVGHTAPRFRQLRYECGPEAVLLLHSDGLSGSWQLDRYPGLLQHNAALIAGVLYRDYRRERDDSMVVVIKRAPP